jgi:hypothetical protein
VEPHQFFAQRQEFSEGPYRRHRYDWSSGSTLDMYSVGDRFESRPGNLKFIMVYISPSRQIVGKYLDLCHDRFQSFPLHQPSHYATVFRLGTVSVIK